MGESRLCGAPHYTTGPFRREVFLVDDLDAEWIARNFQIVERHIDVVFRRVNRNECHVVDTSGLRCDFGTYRTLFRRHDLGTFVEITEGIFAESRYEKLKHRTIDAKGSVIILYVYRWIISVRTSSKVPSPQLDASTQNVTILPTYPRCKPVIFTRCTSKTFEIKGLPAIWSECCS